MIYCTIGLEMNFETFQKAIGVINYNTHIKNLHFHIYYVLELSDYLNSIHYRDSLRLFMNKIVDCPTM